MLCLQLPTLRECSRLGQQCHRPEADDSLFFLERLRYSHKIRFLSSENFCVFLCEIVVRQTAAPPACEQPWGGAPGHGKERVNLYITVSHTMSPGPQGSQTRTTALGAAGQASLPFGTRKKEPHPN